MAGGGDQLDPVVVELSCLIRLPETTRTMERKPLDMPDRRGDIDGRVCHGGRAMVAFGRGGNRGLRRVGERERS